MNKLQTTIKKQKIVNIAVVIDDQGNIMIAPDTPWMLGNR